MELDKKSQREIINNLKVKLNPEYMRPLVIELGNIFTEIEKFLSNEKITVDDCQNLYIYINTRCNNATQMACIEVRKAYNSKTGIFKGTDPCEICPFNVFCSYKISNEWHSNMVNISDLLMDCYRFKKEVTQKDIDYIQGCFDKMKNADNFNKLLNLIDRWSSI